MSIPSPGEERHHPRPRIETLSDLIFGLALSIGALALISKPPGNEGEILAGVVAFTFSFMILILIWIRYTAVMSVMRLETTTTRTLNLLMLFCVSIEPYLFNLVSSPSAIPSLIGYASMLYALDLGGLFLILGLFTFTVTHEDEAHPMQKFHLAPNYLTAFQVQWSSEVISPGIFLVSALPIFWTLQVGPLHLRFWMWFAPFVIARARRLLRPR